VAGVGVWDGSFLIGDGGLAMFRIVWNVAIERLVIGTDSRASRSEASSGCLHARFHVLLYVLAGSSRPLPQHRHDRHPRDQKEHRHGRPRRARAHKRALQPVPRKHLVDADPREDPRAQRVQRANRHQRRGVAAVEAVEHADADGHPDGRHQREAARHEAPR
jgi:hypothetical protein